MARAALDLYQKKRDFNKTAKPGGEDKVAAGSGLRFVMQKHDARRLHYDFLSPAVTRGPSLDPGDKRLAVEVEDHPLDYGDFEGTMGLDWTHKFKLIVAGASARGDCLLGGGGSGAR